MKIMNLNVARLGAYMALVIGLMWIEGNFRNIWRTAAAG
jgi:hypothetical protein